MTIFLLVQKTPNDYEHSISSLHQLFKALCLQRGTSLRTPALHPLPTSPEKSPQSPGFGTAAESLAPSLLTVSGLALWIYFNALFCLPTLPLVKPLRVSTGVTGPAWASCHQAPLTLSLSHTLPKTPLPWCHHYAQKLWFLLIFCLIKTESLCSAFKGFHGRNYPVNVCCFLLNVHY